MLCAQRAAKSGDVSSAAKPASFHLSQPKLASKPAPKPAPKAARAAPKIASKRKFVLEDEEEEDLRRTCFSDEEAEIKRMEAGDPMEDSDSPLELSDDDDDS